MTATILLRVASVLALVHSILHTIGSVLSQPEPGTQAATLAIMKASAFPVTGLTQSYADFYLGLGLFVTVALAIEGIVFWQLATIVKSDGARLRPRARLIHARLRLLRNHRLLLLLRRTGHL